MADWEDDIKRYRKGEMSPEEEHALEKKALNDPFLAEALEGTELISATEFSKDIDELKKRINNKRSQSTWRWPLRIAASVAILLIGYFVFDLVFVNNISKEESIALQSTEDIHSNKNSGDSGVLENKIENTFEQSVKIEKKQKSTQPIVSDNKPIIEQSPQLTIVSEANSNEEEKNSRTEKELLDNKINEALSSENRAAANLETGDVKMETEKKDAQSKTYLVNPSVFPGSQIIKGKVVFAEDGKPLPGTNVLIKGTTQGTVTDINGEYSITTNLSEPVLIYSFIGFQTAEVKVKNKTEVNVSLQSDVSQLSEVVVTGFSPQTNDAREPIIKLAEPVGGRRAYDKYLQNSLIYPAQALENKIKGKVTVQFTVRTDGSLDEFSILKGLGYGCDEEVIRLVKEGPHWKPTTEDDVPVESEVIVRVKFALPD